MPLRQQIFALTVSLVLLVIIIELVRRRRLREEYAWLWIITGTTILGLTLWYDLLMALTHLIGAALPTSTLFLCGMLFLLLISLHYSVQVSTLTNQVKNLSQQMAILQTELETQQEERLSRSDPPKPSGTSFPMTKSF